MKMKNTKKILFLQQKKCFYIFFTLIFCLVLFNSKLYTNEYILNNNFVNNTNFLHFKETDGTPVFINFPNPFNQYTYIYIKFNKVSNCIVSIYDILGNLVKRFYLYDNNEYLLIWNATNDFSKKVSTGGYICVLTYDRGKLIRKIGYIK